MSQSFECEICVLEATRQFVENGEMRRFCDKHAREHSNAMAEPSDDAMIRDLRGASLDGWPADFVASVRSRRSMGGVLSAAQHEKLIEIWKGKP